MATIVCEFPAVKCSNRFSVFDADVLAMIYRRDYLKHKAIACKDRRLWQDYRSQRNAVTRVIRQRKRFKCDFSKKATTKCLHIIYADTLECFLQYDACIATDISPKL